MADRLTGRSVRTRTAHRVDMGRKGKQREADLDRDLDLAARPAMPAGGGGGGRREPSGALGCGPAASARRGGDAGALDRVTSPGMIA